MGRRAVIVGPDHVVAPLIPWILGRTELDTRVVGRLETTPGAEEHTRDRIPVLLRLENLRSLVARHEVDLVLVPERAIPASELRELVSLCVGTGAKVQIIPRSGSSMPETLSGGPRDVGIADLVRPEPACLDTKTAAPWLHGQVVLVTGAAGSIGSEICRQVLACRPRGLILLDHGENALFFLERELLESADGVAIVPWVASITDAPRIRSTFDRFRPTVVLHAAAHKHVPMMEANPGEAVKNNVLGTRIVADEATRAGVETFVMTSTDKAVHPTSVMGATKRVAELYLQARSQESRGTRLVTVRFGNVLGSNGSVVPLFQEQIRRGGPVTLTHPDMRRFFMTIAEATQLVLQAGALGQGGEIFVLDMGEPIRVLDLARDLITLARHAKDGDGNVAIVFTGPRPGEKLQERLHAQDEEWLPTAHPRIFRVHRAVGTLSSLTANLDQLARIVDHPPDEILRALQLLVPDYEPNHAEGAQAGGHETGRTPEALPYEKNGVCGPTAGDLSSSEFAD